MKTHLDDSRACSIRTGAGAWVFLLAVLVCAACDGDGGKGAMEPTAVERASHARMLEALAALVERTPAENEYLGDARLSELDAELAAVGDDGPALARLRVLSERGGVLLRLGRNAEAIEALLAARALVPQVDQDPVPRLVRTLPFELGVAYLRLGETQNCVAMHTSESCILPIGPAGVHADPSGSRAAIPFLAESLATSEPDSPQALCSRWLLNLAYMTIGEWPAGVPADERMDIPKLMDSGVAFPRFRDVAPALGINTFDLSGGALADDFDRDGRFDLVVSTWDVEGQMRFWHNAGADGFEDRTVAAGLEGLTGGLNMIHGDVDGNGDPDVFVLRGAWLRGEAGRHPNSLLLNERGVFTDVTFAAGLGEVHYPTQTAGFADYDNDGDLDLYIGNEAVEEAPFPCQLFRNEGDGTFVDVAAAAGVENIAYAKGVTWGDFDGDRFPDLYVSNLGERNRLYRNRGDGTFEDVARERKVVLPLSSFPTWFWDYDDDGDLDLWVSGYYQARLFRLWPVVASWMGLPHPVAKPARLYRNDGRGGFDEVAGPAGIGGLTMPMGCNFGDLDNDGRSDFYLGTGYPGYEGLMPNVMYWNRGGTFTDVTAAGGFGHLQKGHAVVFADLDGDGDQDVFEQMGGAFPGDAFGNVLFENPGFGNHWMQLRLVGVKSNRSGLGARVTLEFDDAGTPRKVHRQVSGGGSFGGNPFTLHLGLGRAERVGRLEVYWPTSDTRQVFENLAIARRYVLEEGGEPVPREVTSAPFPGAGR